MTPDERASVKARALAASGRSAWHLAQWSVRGVEDVIAALDALDQAEAQVAQYRRAHSDACVLVAQMHAAAVGDVTGPARGVVEDVEDVRLRAENAEAEVERLRGALAASEEARQHHVNFTSVIEAERDAARAQVAAVRALCYDPDPDTDDGMTYIAVDAIRAAIDGEATP